MLDKTVFDVWNEIRYKDTEGVCTMILELEKENEKLKRELFGAQNTIRNFRDKETARFNHNMREDAALRKGKKYGLK